MAKLQKELAKEKEKAQNSSKQHEVSRELQEALQVVERDRKELIEKNKKLEKTKVRRTLYIYSHSQKRQTDLSADHLHLALTSKSHLGATGYDRRTSRGN